MSFNLMAKQNHTNRTAFEILMKTYYKTAVKKSAIKN